MGKFQGNFEELKALLEQGQIIGNWNEGNGCLRFTTEGNDTNKGILNFWPNKGSYNIQGRGLGKTKLEAILSGQPELAISHSAGSVPSAPAARQASQISNKVFVVYGHNQQARTQLDAMLRKWGLEPVILDNLPSKGLTIIEKLEEYTADAGFGIVLATADDEGFPKGQEGKKLFRVRQNVVLELGMLLVKLGRSKVAILLEKNHEHEIESPSDIQGLLYIPFKDDVAKDAGVLLAKEMAPQGYKIDIENL
ncbi:MAG: DNA-binding protein [Candidatus Tokpelaia sp.]|nr:MAG: DNA-binding protein [Candidatus Tokpelaia sp.]KAA6206748.1 MAG: DNA-binding protein [Candidatus Tokpelaia sp.]